MLTGESGETGKDGPCASRESRFSQLSRGGHPFATNCHESGSLLTAPQKIADFCQQFLFVGRRWRSRRRRSCFFFQPIHLFDQHEDDEGNDAKVRDALQKDPVIKRRGGGRFRRHQGWCGVLDILMKRLEKSTLPISGPRGGMRTSLTSDETILPKAPPMITPIAMSRTLPLMAPPPSTLSAFCPLSQAAKQSGFMLRQAQHERITPAYSMSAPFALRLSMDERRVFRSLLEWGLGMIDNSRDGHALYGLGPPVSGLSSVETECGMQGAHGQFEILFVNHAGDFDLRGADHHDIDALAREHFEHFRRDS